MSARDLPSLAAALLARGEMAVVVRLTEVAGSSPQRRGAIMLVTSRETFGTVGGGRLEWELTAHARQRLEGAAADEELSMALGPSLGQCCGGQVTARLEQLRPAHREELQAAEVAARAAAPEVIVCGAGHVGKALVRTLVGLPLAVHWADARRGLFPKVLPVPQSVGGSLQTWQEPPRDSLDRVGPGAGVFVMTHSHQLDYEIVEAALARRDVCYVGLIGSATKRRRFEKWYLARGGDADRLASLTSPIGNFGVDDKRPEIIAALAAAEVLVALDRAKNLAAQPPMMEPV